MYGFIANERDVQPDTTAPKFKVGQRVRNTVVPEAGEGIVEGYSDTGACIVNYKDTWFKRCHEVEDQLAPAFLPGDRVRVTKHNCHFAFGDECVVERQTDVAVYIAHGPYQRIGLPIDADALELIAEPGAGNKGQLRNPDDVPSAFTVVADKFRVVWPPAAAQPCIVARVVDGTPRPSNVPYVHASVASATTEAERLASNNPGQEFAVYQRVAGWVAEVEYNMREVA